MGQVKLYGADDSVATGPITIQDWAKYAHQQIDECVELQGKIGTMSEFAGMFVDAKPLTAQDVAETIKRKINGIANLYSEVA